ncbi:MAG: hypothetical protein PWR07_2318 [Bacillota bacterium]|nr:hypothetical protein [Bacillota bacterium]
MGCNTTHTQPRTAPVRQKASVTRYAECRDIYAVEVVGVALRRPAPRDASLGLRLRPAKSGAPYGANTGNVRQYQKRNPALAM